jgi:hypothetical protein
MQQSFVERIETPTGAFAYATSEIAGGSKLGIDGTKKLPGDGFKQICPR